MSSPHFSFTQPIRQLEKRKGGYFYFHIDKAIVDQFEKQRKTRLVCRVENQIDFSCGLNHLGDGNFFIILAGRHLKTMGKELGDEVQFEIFEDPNPLGVAMPEVLEVLLAQDEDSRQTFESITDGKKRSLIYAINRVKDVDKQVAQILKFLEEQKLLLIRKGVLS